MSSPRPRSIRRRDVLGYGLPVLGLGLAAWRLTFEDHLPAAGAAALVVLPIPLVLLGLVQGRRRAERDAADRDAIFGAMATVWQKSLSSCPLVARQLPKLHPRKEYPRGARCFVDQTGLTVVGGPWARRRGVTEFALGWADIARIDIGQGPGVSAAGTAGLVLTLRDGSSLPMAVRRRSELEAALRQVTPASRLVSYYD